MTLIRIIGYNLKEDPAKIVYGPWPYNLDMINASGLTIPPELVIPFDKPRMIDGLDHETLGDRYIYRGVSDMLPGKDEKIGLGGTSRVNAFIVGEDWLRLVSENEDENGASRESKKGIAIQLYIITDEEIVKRIYEMQRKMRTTP